MSRFAGSSRLALLAVLAALALVVAGIAAANGPGGPRADRDETTILVKFRTAAEGEAIVAAVGDDEAAEVTGRVKVVKLKAGKSVDEAIAEYRGRAGVVYAEPNFVATTQLAAPNDTSYSSQWALPKIKAPDAWSLHPGAYASSGGATIAIADTGVDLTHGDLAAKILPGTGANCVSGTCSGSTSANDDHGHGTHVAGIAAAVTNNATGVAGLAIDAGIIPVKVLNQQGSGSYAGIANGIRWATDHGADVINLSLGGYGYSSTLCAAVTYAVSNDVVLVAAAGNEATSDALYPAACPGAVGVASTTSTDARSSFSNTGTANVFVAAPGSSIYSTYRQNQYATMSGTSMASPFVAGLAGLLVAQVPTRTVADVRLVLATTSDKVGGVVYGADPKGTCGTCTWSSTHGYGRINALAALTEGAGPPPPPSPDFSLAASPTSASAVQGASAGYTISTTALNGFSGSIVLGVSGLPADASASIVPGTVAVGSGSALTVQTGASTPTGSYTLTILGTSGSLTRSTTLTLNVTAAPGFTISASPSSRAVKRGKTTTYTVSVAGQGGYSTPVALSVSGLPSGAGASFSSNPVTPGGSSTLTVTTSGSAPRGTFALTITGASGGLQKTTTVSLTLR